MTSRSSSVRLRGSAYAGNAPARASGELKGTYFGNRMMRIHRSEVERYEEERLSANRSDEATTLTSGKEASASSIVNLARILRTRPAGSSDQDLCRLGAGVRIV
jgi:hypothetical protein